MQGFDLMAGAADFGSGLGAIIGGQMATSDLSDANNRISGLTSGFSSAVQPYNDFGQSMIPGASETLGRLEGEAGNDPNTNFNTFMSNYSASPGAKYLMSTATEAQNESAAAKGGLLSGSNERALSTINQGIAGTQANQAFQNYLAGNNQQFGQIESVLGNMFQGMGLGETATGQLGSLEGTQIGADAQIAQAQAKADQSKGSGFGSLFSGLGSMAMMF